MADLRLFYRRELRRLNANARGVSNPKRIALRINRRLAKEGRGQLTFIQEIVGSRFKKQINERGQPWRVLAAATQKQRQRLGFGASRPILRRSNTLALAMINGRSKASDRNIIMKPRNPPAPRYIGKGKSKGGSKTGGAKRVLVYAGALDKVRRFYGPPSRRELGPLIKRRDQLIKLVFNAIQNNRPISSVI